MPADAGPPPPRQDDPLHSAFSAVLGEARASGLRADLVHERVAKAEATLLASGSLQIKPLGLRSATQLRLLGPGGRQVSLRVGRASPEALTEALETGRAALRDEPPQPGGGLAEVPHRERQRYGLPIDLDPRDEDAGPLLAQVVQAVQDLCAEASGARAAVRPEVWAWTQVEEKWVLDSEGLYKTQVMPVTFVQVVLRALSEGRVARTRLRWGEPLGLRRLVGPGGLRPDLAHEVRTEAAAAVALLDARPLSAAEHQALDHYLLHHSALVFLHEGLGHPIEADIVRADGSAILHPDGRPRVDPLGSPIVRIVDGLGVGPQGEASTEQGFGTELIDDEGVETTNTLLVDQGQIVGMMHSRETAHHFGVSPTGNGFSDLGQRRLVRMRNTYFAPQPGPHWVDRLEDLAADVQLGLVLHGSLGGAVTRLGMSSSTQYGRLIRGGRLTGDWIGPANFTAETAGCLQTVRGFAGAISATGVGFCGKSGQTRRVTDGGPTWVKLGRSPALHLAFEG